MDYWGEESEIGYILDPHISNIRHSNLGSRSAMRPIRNNHIGNIIYEDMLTYMIVALFLYESI